MLVVVGFKSAVVGFWSGSWVFALVLLDCLPQAAKPAKPEKAQIHPYELHTAPPHPPKLNPTHSQKKNGGGGSQQQLHAGEREEHHDPAQQQAAPHARQARVVHLCVWGGRGDGGRGGVEVWSGLSSLHVCVVLQKRMAPRTPQHNKGKGARECQETSDEREQRTRNAVQKRGARASQGSCRKHWVPRVGRGGNGQKERLAGGGTVKKKGWPVGGTVKKKGKRGTWYTSVGTARKYSMSPAVRSSGYARTAHAGAPAAPRSPKTRASGPRVRRTERRWRGWWW